MAKRAHGWSGGGVTDQLDGWPGVVMESMFSMGVVCYCIMLLVGSAREERMGQRLFSRTIPTRQCPSSQSRSLVLQFSPARRRDVGL
jgi:hypothetical protein